MTRCFLWVLAAVACGGGGGDDDSGADAPVLDVSDGGFVTAAHTAMPEATSLGGPVIAAPKMVAISFNGDTAMQPTIDTFASQMQASAAYWNGAVGEYGVGPITTTTFHSSDAPAASLTDAQVQAWISNAIQTVTGFPQPDASTIYTLFYPSGTNVTSGTGVTCQQFQGYHDSFTFNGGNVIYAVVPRCPPPMGTSATVADQMTAEASHELAEASTDPTPGATKPGYITVDTASQAWTLLAGGEVGDLCAAYPNSFFKPSGFDHLVQRIWSNQSAASNHDPCEPQGTSPYFNAAPVLPDQITVNGGGASVLTAGVKLSKGQSKTVELDLYSDAPTPPWTVSVYDISSAFFGAPSPVLTFSLDQSTGQNGDKLQLTITAQSSSPGGALFWIESDSGPGAGSGIFQCQPPTCQATVWLGAVAPF